jgi:DNA (cytosine-5)-methyltransferase 1
MMGLPVGHVTDPALGLTRNEQLKLLGNGVCPQQAEAAIRALWARVTAPWSVAP